MAMILMIIIDSRLNLMENSIKSIFNLLNNTNNNIRAKMGKTITNKNYKKESYVCHKLGHISKNCWFNRTNSDVNKNLNSNKTNYRYNQKRFYNLGFNSTTFGNSFTNDNNQQINNNQNNGFLGFTQPELLYRQIQPPEQYRQLNQIQYWPHYQIRQQ